jgi:uncharacterized protein (TIGR02996 family)
MRGLDGFEHVADDHAHGVISALLADCFADERRWERATRRETKQLLALETRASGRPFLAATPSDHEALLLALGDRLDAVVRRPDHSSGRAWAAYSVAPGWHYQNVLELLFARLLARKLSYGEATLLRLLELAEAHYRVSTLTVLGHVQRHLDGATPKGAISDALRGLRERTPDWRDNERLLERLAALLDPPVEPALAPRREGPGDPQRLLADVDEPWLEALRLALTKAPDDHDHWRGLLAHAEAAQGKAQPTQAWLALARQAIDALGPEATAAVLQPTLLATSDLPRGGDSESAKQLAGPAGELIKALCWLGAALPADARQAARLVDALEGAAAAFYTRVENIGARCAKAGGGAIVALGLCAANAENSAVRALSRLSARLRYQAAKRSTEGALERAAKSRGLPVATLLAEAATAPELDEAATLERLKEATAALSSDGAASDDPATALPLLLEAWRGCPAVRLAEAIEAIEARSRQLDAEGEPTNLGRTKPQRAARFLELATEHDPATLPTLLAALDRDNQREAATQLRALEGWPADPRLASVLCELFERPPYRHRKTWQAVADLLAQQGDPRTLRRLAAIDIEAIENLVWADVLVQTRERLSVEGSPEPTLTPTITQALTALEAALPRPAPERPLTRQRADEADALLAQIAADPEDDDLRRLYADVLLEAGDLRGELITLQLAGKLTAAQRKRERELLAAHAVEWLGELGPLFQRGGLRYTRGLPAAGRIDGEKLAAAMALHGDPRWGSFVELEIKGWRCPAAALAHPVLRGLRALIGVDLETVAALCKADPDPATQPRQLERLSCGLGVDEDEPEDLQRWKTVLAGAGLPRLRDLCVTSYLDNAERDALLDSPLGRRLEQLTMQVSYGDAIVWLTTLATRRSGPARLTVVESFRSWQLTLTRGASGRWDQLHCDYGGKPAWYDAETRQRLDELLARLPSGAVDSVTVAERWR